MKKRPSFLLCFSIMPRQSHLDRILVIEFGYAVYGILNAKTKICNHRYQWFSSILKNSSVVWFTEEFFNMDLNHWYLWLHSYCCCCCCFIKGSRNKSWTLHSLMGYFANHLWFNLNIFSANCHNIIPKEKILMPS